MSLKRYYSHLMATGRIHVPTREEAHTDFVQSERLRLQGELARRW